MLRKYLIAPALIVAALLSPADAVVGTPPGTGPGLTDGAWLYGVVEGLNWVYISGITATGSNQATAFQLGSTYELYQVDTVAASTGVALPQCVAGATVKLFNNGANTLTIYPSIANNALTGAQDTINGASSVTANTKTAHFFMCAKNGTWGFL